MQTESARRKAEMDPLVEMHALLREDGWQRAFTEAHGVRNAWCWTRPDSKVQIVTLLRRIAGGKPQWYEVRKRGVYSSVPRLRKRLEELAKT